MKAKKTTVRVEREVIIDGQHCHDACVGNCGFWCAYFQKALKQDYRCKVLRLLRGRECRAATRGRDG